MTLLELARLRGYAAIPSAANSLWEKTWPVTRMDDREYAGGVFWLERVICEPGRPDRYVLIEPCETFAEAQRKARQAEVFSDRFYPKGQKAWRHRVWLVSGFCVAGVVAMPLAVISSADD
jgi:hypothetical protein